MYKRKCENWLLTFRDWTIPRSEAQESFIFWTGLFSLASVLRRNVVIPKTLLGSWEVYPFMYVFFISPAGRGRKTTTMTYADDLLDDLVEVHTVAQAITQQDLLKRMAEMGEPSVSIRALEFGTFYKPSGDAMIDFLTAMFDGRKKYDSSTISRAYEFTSKPCINMLAATTPAWITDNLSESMVGGGFMSRVVPIYEETVRRRQLYYENLDYKALEGLRIKLIADLQHLTTIKGSFSIDEEAKTYSEQWYRAVADKYEKETDPRLHGYYERKPAYIFKVAMLLHLAYSDELVITAADFKMALTILNGIEKKILRVYSTVGKNPYTDVMDKIVEYIREKKEKGVSKIELLGRFYHEAEPEALWKLIQALMVMEKIELDGSSPTKPVFRISNHKEIKSESSIIRPE